MSRNLGFAGSLLLVAAISYFTRQSDWHNPHPRRQREALAELMGRNRRAFPDADEVDFPKLISLMKQTSVVLVDVRSAAERDVSVIPNAISVAEFERTISGRQGETVICYCTIGYRSARYAQAMKRRGVRVTSFNGSIVAWCQAGQGLTTPEGRSTNLVHIYGPQWNLLPPDFQAVW